MKTWTLRLLVLTALVLATLGVTRAGRAQVATAPQQRVRSLPALPFLEVVALGYREAAADLAWIQAVQYYGEHRQGGNDLSEFGHFLDAVNQLDPRYEHAYVLGAFVLATDASDLETALAVLRRGSRALPQSYRIPFEMGFLTYVMGGDADEAAHYFGFAALKPGGRQRALRFQAFLNRRLGRLETAWALWQDLYRSADNPAFRVVAKEALEKIEAELRLRDSQQPAASGTPKPPASGEGS